MVVEIINEMGVDASEYNYISDIMKYLAENLHGDYSLVATSFFGENYSVKGTLPRTKFKTVSFITGDEWNQNPAYLDDPNLLLMFKTCVPRAGQHPKLFPLPLGTYRRFDPYHEYDINDRSYDITFYGQVTCQQRREMADEIGLWIAQRPAVHSFLTYTKKYADGAVEPYSAIMRDTKIALNPSPGNNVTVDSTRYFEGMAAGCVVISTRRPHTWFYNGAPHIEVGHWREAGPIIDDLLSNPSRMEEMSKAAYAWWSNVCSPEAVGRYILELTNTRK